MSFSYKKAPYFLVSIFKGLTYQTTKAFKANKRKILKFERSERYWIRSYYLPITNAYHFMIKKENLPLDRTRKNIKKLLFFHRKKLEATTINFLGIKFTTSRLLWSFKNCSKNNLITICTDKSLKICCSKNDTEPNHQ